MAALLQHGAPPVIPASLLALNRSTGARGRCFVLSRPHRWVIRPWAGAHPQIMSQARAVPAGGSISISGWIPAQGRDDIDVCEALCAITGASPLASGEGAREGMLPPGWSAFLPWHGGRNGPLFSAKTLPIYLLVMEQCRNQAGHLTNRKRGEPRCCQTAGAGVSSATLPTCVRCLRGRHAGETRRVE